MSPRRIFKPCALLALMLIPALISRAAESFLVTQSGRAFSMRTISVKRGDTIHFTNADEFLHQIYVKSPTFNFASDEQDTGQTVDIRFPESGTFQVRCEIHPKMLLTVKVD